MKQREMQKLKLKQFCLVFLATLSLFVSSVSACACSHHQQAHAEETETHSCHSAESEHSAESVEGDNICVSQTDCFCFQHLPEVFAKAETVNVEKQSAELLQSSPVENSIITAVAAAKTVDFESPFYLSESFYNLSPGRAPPRL